MIRIAVVLCLVATATATCCSAGDMKKVTEAWNGLWNNADAATTKVIFGREVFNKYVTFVPLIS